MKSTQKETSHRTSILAVLMIAGLFGDPQQYIRPVQPGEPAIPITLHKRKEPRWISVNPLKAARFDHSATLLPNGKVFVAGGFGDGMMLSSCELFDPETGTWTPTGKLNKARQRHTATLLKNGKVLVVGGAPSDPRKYDASAELYDPATGTCRLTGSLKVGRIHHTATLLADGRVLVAAGYDGQTPLSSAEVYHPASETWRKAAGLKEDRMNAAATLLRDGKVLVTGGAGRNGTSSAELYDAHKDTWTKTGSMSINRWFHTATLLTSGKILVEEGAGYPFSTDSRNRASAELYDPAVGKWTRTASVGKDRNSHTATLLPNGKVLIVGGDPFGDQGGILPGGGRLVSTELYDPITETWRAWANMNASRALHTTTLLLNGRLLVVGGISNNVALRSAEMIDVTRLDE